MKAEDMNGDLGIAIWLFITIILAGAMSIAQYLSEELHERANERRRQRRYLREKKERELFDELIHRKR